MQERVRPILGSNKQAKGKRDKRYNYQHKFITINNGNIFMRDVFPISENNMKSGITFFY